MSWEDLPERARKSRTAWGVSVAKTGGAISIWLPDGHPLNQAKFIKTQIGAGEHLGWIRVSAAESGRRLQQQHGKPKSPKYIRYSTLPGNPPYCKMTEIPNVKTEPSGAVMIRLPWKVPGAPFAILDGAPQRQVAR